MHQKVVLYLCVNFVTYIKDLEISIFLALFDTFILLVTFVYEHFISKCKVCYAQCQKSELFSTNLT